MVSQYHWLVCGYYKLSGTDKVCGYEVRKRKDD